MPPDIVNDEQLLKMLQTIYSPHHRGARGKEIGGYDFSRVSDREFIMTVNKPYHFFFDQGVIIGFGEQVGHQVALEHLGDECRTMCDPACTCRIRINCLPLVLSVTPNGETF